MTIKQTLHFLGFRSKHIGFLYLSKCIEICIQQQGINTLNTIYQVIAEEYNVPIVHIYASVNYILESYWDLYKDRVITPYWNERIDYKPKCKEFILLLSQICVSSSNNRFTSSRMFSGTVSSVRKLDLIKDT